MTAQEIMTAAAVTIAPHESALTAARLLSRYNIGALPVVTADGKLRGILTDRDIALRCVAAGSDPGATMVAQIMSRRLVTVSPKEDVAQAARLMSQRQVRRVAVTDEQKRLLGVLSLGDLALAKGYDTEAAAALTEISGNLKRL